MEGEGAGASHVVDVLSHMERTSSAAPNKESQNQGVGLCLCLSLNFFCSCFFCINTHFLNLFCSTEQRKLKSRCVSVSGLLSSSVIYIYIYIFMYIYIYIYI